MVSSRLQELAPETEKLGYLDANDGYWADLVLAACAFLEARGYALETVSFHHHGDYITYRGPRGTISFEFLPDAGFISGRARLSGGVLSFEGDLDLLARLHDPGTRPPPTLPLGREVIEDNVRFGAKALRSADDML